MQIVSQTRLIASMQPTQAQRPAAAHPEHMQPVQKLAAKPAVEKSGLWQAGSFSFGDFVDMINPLQHLPVISTIYRKLTGDEMGNAARVVGGTLFGGLLGSWVSGLVSSLANAFVSEKTGKDIGAHMVSAPTRAATPGMHTSSPEPRVIPLRSASIEVPPLNSTSINPVAQTTPAASQQEVISQIKSQGMQQYQRQILVDQTSKNTDYWV